MAKSKVLASVAKVGRVIAGKRIISVGKRVTVSKVETCPTTKRSLEPGNYRECEIEP